MYEDELVFFKRRIEQENCSGYPFDLCGYCCGICFSLLWVLAFYVTDRVGICITDVNEMLLMTINSEHDKKEKALYMTTFAINNEYFLDDYYAKEKNIKNNYV